MATWALVRRELGATLWAPTAVVLAAAVLFIDGLLFNLVALGGASQLSQDVLESFFFSASGTTLIAAVFLGMPLLAQERQNGTLVLLTTSPMPEAQVVAGKFIAAWLVLVAINSASFYMPLLLMWQGKISLGHVLAGYLGLALLAGAALSLALLASALAPTPLLASIGAATLVTGMLLLWLAAGVSSPPLDRILAYLSLHDRHFRPFMRGIVSSQDVLFYLSLTYLALMAAVRSMEARRWR